MGNQLEWQDRFNIGVEVIDREHKIGRAHV